MMAPRITGALLCALCALSMLPALASAAAGVFEEVTSSAAFGARNTPGIAGLTDGTLVVMGGILVSDGSTPADLYTSADEGATWVQADSDTGTGGRSDFPVLVSGSKIYIGGGGAPPTNVYSATTSDLTAWTQEVSNPSWAYRVGHAMVLAPNGKVLVIAGSNADLSPRNDVWSAATSDLATWTQETAAASFPGRWRFGCVVSDGRVIVIGGGDSSGSGAVFDDVWASTDNGATWTQTSTGQFTGRMGVGAAVSPDGAIVVVGGRQLSGPISSVLVSTDYGATFTDVTGTSMPARAHPGFVISSAGKAIVIAGVETGSNEVATVWAADRKQCTAGERTRGVFLCETCPANTFAAAGASACTACPAGHTSAAGATACTAPADDDDTVMLIVIIVAGVVVLAAIAVFIVTFMKGKGKNGAVAPASAAVGGDKQPV